MIGRLGSRLRRFARKNVRVIAVVLALVAGAVVAKVVLFSGDGTESVAAVRVQVLAPGSFEASHPFAPYYVVPDKRVARPSRLSRAARNTFVTAPESALKKGALAGSPQILRLRVRAGDDTPVRITAVRAKIVSDARPLKGWFTASPGCMFERDPVARVNLDSKRRSSRALDIAVTRLGAGEIEVQASTRRRRVAWTAQLVVTGEDGATGTVDVDDSGEPFRVTAPTASEGYTPVFGATGVESYARVRSWDDGVESGC